MERHNFYISEKQYSVLDNLSEQTGLPNSELLRRFIDFCSKTTVLDELIPYLSGQLSTRIS